MGLDMYLYKKNHLTEEQKLICKEAKAMLNAYEKLYDNAETEVEKKCWNIKMDEWHDKLSKVQEYIEVCYWRKANAIHAWFERYLRKENGIEAIENCEAYAISMKCLEELVLDCKAVLAYSRDKCFEEVASRYMPTQGGFFYGSTDYGEWYVHDLQETATELASILLNSDEDDEFIYTAWW